MRIKMLTTRRGSEDGFIVHEYHKDCIYDVAHSLAVSFMQGGYAYNAEEGEDGDSRERALQIAAAREQAQLRTSYYHWMLHRPEDEPLIMFEAWLQNRLHPAEKLELRVPTNPATLAATGRIEP